MARPDIQAIPFEITRVNATQKRWRVTGSNAHDVGILANENLQIVPFSTNHFDDDLAFIDELRRRERRAGITLQDVDATGKLQHDQVYDVFTLYQAQQDLDKNPQILDDFTNYMYSQLKATVLEQYEAFRNTISYDIDDDGFLYSKDLKNKRIIEAFYRGSRVLKTVRERREAELMEEVEKQAGMFYLDKDNNKHYVNPSGKIYIGFSPHDQTGRYPDEVVNIFQIHDDALGRHVILDRIKLGNFSEENFMSLGETFDPTYLPGQPEDMAFSDYAVGKLIELPLDNAFGTNATEVLETVFGELPDEEEEKIQLLTFAMPTIRAYITALTTGDFDTNASWRNLAERKNAIDDIHGAFLAKQSELLKKKLATDVSVMPFRHPQAQTALAVGMYQGVFQQDKQANEARKAKGCGLISKLEIADGIGGTTTFGMKRREIVAGPGNSGKSTEEKVQSFADTVEGTCPDCGNNVIAPVDAECRIICPTTGCKFSSEGRKGITPKQEVSQQQVDNTKETDNNTTQKISTKSESKEQKKVDASPVGGKK